MAPSRRQLGLRAAYSGLSSVAGFSIFIVWTVVYSQPWTAAMGGLAGTPGLGGRWGRVVGRGEALCSRGSSRVTPPGGAGGGCLPKTSFRSAGLSRPKPSPRPGAAPGADVPLGLAPACLPGAAAWGGSRPLARPLPMAPPPCAPRRSPPLPRAAPGLRVKTLQAHLFWGSRCCSASSLGLGEGRDG